MTFPTALAAPVEAGIMFWAAPLPSLHSFPEGPSTVFCVAVMAWTVVCGGGREHNSENTADVPKKASQAPPLHPKGGREGGCFSPHMRSLGVGLSPDQQAPDLP